MTNSRALRFSNRRTVVLAAALAIVQVHCGNNNNPNGPSESFTQTRTLPPLESFGVAFTAQRNGTVDANVDWGGTNNDIQVYAASGSCASIDALRAGGCNVIAFSESATAKPETITFAAVKGTTYTVFALNQGPGTDIVTIQLVAH
jgi:hypothetical protein